MAFIWDTNPNRITPPPILPVPVGDGEMSYEAKEVANSVNVDPIYGVGTLLWNIATPDADGDSDGDFDIIYQLPSLNVKDIHVTHLEADNVTVYFNATINTANIGTVTINTANIVNATIANGLMGMNPTANLQIATKEYVDALAANSVPLGGNLQLLIQSAGDLLVGVSDNTAERLPIGTTDGMVLVAGGSGNTGVYWKERRIGGSGVGNGSFRGLSMGTSTRSFLEQNSTVEIISVDAITMDDRSIISTGWAGLTANIRSNIATSGVGFLDTGVVQDNTIYEVWAIRSSSNGAQGLLLHQAKDRKPDVNNHVLGGIYTTTRSVRYVSGFNSMNCINISQSFTPTKNGPLVGVEMMVTKTGTINGNCWITLEANNAQGNASGIPLATSRYKNANNLSNISMVASRTRFIFDTTANVVAGTPYHVVYHGDYPIAGSQTNEQGYTKVSGWTSGTASPGQGKNFNANTGGWAIANSAQVGDIPLGPCDFWLRTYVETNNTPIIMPTGYDQKCLLSYISTTLNRAGVSNTNIRRYTQFQRTMTMSWHEDWNLPLGIRPAEGGTFWSYSCPVICQDFFPPISPLIITLLSSAVGPTPLGAGNHDACGLLGPSASFNRDEEVDFVAYANNNSGLWMFTPIVVEEQTFQYRNLASVGFGALFCVAMEF